MTDLLPPSPVPSMYGTRTFAPSPSLLGPPSTQGESSQSSRNNSSSPLRTGSPDNMTSADMSLSTANSYSYSANGSSFATTSPNTSFGPTTRPLDYTAILVSHEATHIELARTVDDLTQWLSVVEVGLTGMLEKAFEDTIEEEQEGLPEASVSLDVDHEPPGENSLHDTSIAISNDPILAPAARP
ncbi:hypothetical protein PLICRDRAFT_103827 [Plicaturopsis crispa FD-325 SS-3]|nr:hypothetical protein PLICRDRAFT_103827 [Plicaturopsis crispa FD-325 SS-3]